MRRKTINKYKLQELVEQGLTDSKIAEEMGYTVASVRRARLRNGFQDPECPSTAYLTARRAARTERWAEAAEYMRNHPGTRNDWMKATGYSKDRLRLIIREYNLTPIPGKKGEHFRGKQEEKQVPPPATHSRDETPEEEITVVVRMPEAYKARLSALEERVSALTRELSELRQSLSSGMVFIPQGVQAPAQMTDSPKMVEKPQARKKVKTVKANARLEALVKKRLQRKEEQGPERAADIAPDYSRPVPQKKEKAAPREIRSCGECGMWSEDGGCLYHNTFGTKECKSNQVEVFRQDDEDQWPV